MLRLDLTQWSSSLKIRSSEATPQVFDPIRRDWIAFTQEEMVRQLLIQYLFEVHQFPLQRMSVERKITFHGLSRRYDLVLFDRKAKPFLLAECKAPAVPVNQAVMDQAARYNISLKVPYLFITNGRQSHCCEINFEKGTWKEMDDLSMLLASGF